MNRDVLRTLRDAANQNAPELLDSRGLRLAFPAVACSHPRPPDRLGKFASERRRSPASCWP